MFLIRPIVGRSVRVVAPFVADHPEKHEAALIVNVHGVRMVSLVIFDAKGQSRFFSSMPLRQPGEVAPAGEFCEFLPDPEVVSDAPVSVLTTSDSLA